MRRRTPGRPTASAAVVVCLALGGCTADTPAPDDPESSSVDSPTSDPAASATSTAPSTTSTAPSTPSEASTTSQSTTTTPDTTQPPTTTRPTPPASSAAGRARAALIKAAELPGFNEEWVWDRHRSLRGPGEEPPPVCSVTSMIAIGGVVASRTDYRSNLSEDASAAWRK